MPHIARVFAKNSQFCGADGKNIAGIKRVFQFFDRIFGGKQGQNMAGRRQRGLGNIDGRPEG